LGVLLEQQRVLQQVQRAENTDMIKIQHLPILMIYTKKVVVGYHG
jgi:hypothetical protein